MKRYFQVLGEQQVITLDLNPDIPAPEIAAQLGKQIQELAPWEKRELEKKMRCQKK